jgi:peptidoglycan lytic transglycosylase
MLEMRAKMITAGLLGAAVMLPLDHAKADQVGHASWYSLPANITANGEHMNPNDLTAAHRSLPFGTRVLVENLSNGRSVVVRINDRGPFMGGRIIDLSKAAAATIGMIDAGSAKVRVTTTDGGALGALGEGTAKAKDGTSVAVAGRVDIAPSDSPKEASAAPAPSRTKKRTIAATASMSAKKYSSKVKVAAAKRARVAKAARPRVQVAASSNGIRAAALQASGLSSRLVRVASNDNPYAILGATPGVMKPSRTRVRGAG